MMTFPGLLGPAAKDAVPALVEALKDNDSAVRSYAASTLGKIGPAARDAVPALKALSENDPNPDVRGVAATALLAIRKPNVP